MRKDDTQRRLARPLRKEDNSRLAQDLRAGSLEMCGPGVQRSAVAHTSPKLADCQNGRALSPRAFPQRAVAT